MYSLKKIEKNFNNSNDEETLYTFDRYIKVIFSYKDISEGNYLKYKAKINNKLEKLIR